MINTTNLPPKTSHRIALSTRNNAFIRTKQFFGKQDLFDSAPLNIDNQTSEKIFQNNQIIAQNLIDAKNQRLHRKSSAGSLETSTLDPTKSIYVQKNHDSNLLKDSRRALAHTLSMPKVIVPGNNAKATISNPSSICDPSMDQVLPKLENFAIDPVAVIKEVKAMKRFLDDRKELRKVFKQKSDISYLSDLKRETKSNRDSQIFELRLAVQNQLSSPVPENDSSSKNNIDETRIKHAKSVNVSSSENRDRSLAQSSLPLINNIELNRRPSIKMPLEQASPQSDRLQFLQADTHRSNEQKSMRLNNLLLTPIANQRMHFSREFFPDTKYHEGALLNLENLQVEGYLSGFSETFSGAVSPIKQTSSFVPKVNDKSEGNPSRLPKSIWEKSFDSQALIEDLKKEIPNIMSSFPPSRKDTVALSHWIEEKLTAVIESSGMTEKQKCLNCDEIYNIGLNEIIRQVRFDCAERADLLSRLWMSYLNIFNQFKLSLLADQAKLHDEYEEAYNRVHKMYKDMMAETNAQRDRLQLQLQEMIAEKSTLELKHEKLAKLEAKFLQKNRDLRNVLKKTAKQMEKLKEDNEAMNIRLLARNIFLPNKSERTSQTKIPGMNRMSTQVEERMSSSVGMGQEFSPLRINKEEEIAGEKDSTATEVSSVNLAYDMNQEADGEEKKTENIHKIEQLNSLALVHMVPDVIRYFDDHGIQTGQDLYEFNHHSAACQTDLRLLSGNYDVLLDQQSHLDELVIDYKLKKEVEVIESAGSFGFYSPDASVANLGSVRMESLTNDMNNQNEILRSSFPRPRIQTRRFSNTEGESDRSPEYIAKKKTQKILQKGKQKNSNAHLIRDSGKSSSHKSKTSTETLSNVNNIEDDLSQGLSPMRSELSAHRESEDITEENNTSNAPAEDRKIEGKTSNGVGGMPRENSNTGVSEKEENMNKSESLEMSSLIIDYDIKRDNSVEKGATNDDSELQINLDELDPDELYSSDENRSIQEGEEGSSPSFSIIVEDEEENIPQSAAVILSPKGKEASLKKEFIIPHVQFIDKSPPSVFQEQQQQVDQQPLPNQQPKAQIATSQNLAAKPLSLVLPAKSHKSRISIQYKVGANSKKNALHSLATIKSRIEHFMQKHHIGGRGANVEKLSEIPTDNQNISLDNSKYMQVIKLYKIETEKTKFLQQTINELKENSEKESKTKSALAEENERIKVQLEELSNQINELNVGLENSYPKCKHGRCKYCREDEEAAAKEEEEKATLDMEDDTELNGEDAVNRRRRRRKENNKIIPQTIQFGRRNAIDRKDNPAPAIIAKLRLKKMSQFKNFMPLKFVLKQITSLYDERLRLSRENTIIKDEELSCFTFNTFLNLFGFKKIAEQKFIVLILSVKKNMHILRVNVFGRFMGLVEGAGNYTLEEFNKYIDCIDFLNSCNLGINTVSNEGDPKLYTPYVRFLEYLKSFAEGRMGIEEYLEFKKDFEAMKEIDPKGVNRYGIMDVDMAFMKVVTKYRITSNRVKQFVIDAFQSMDIDGEKSCNLRKFKLLLKYVEPDKYDEEFVKDVFEDYAETNANDVQLLSYDKFAELCVEFNLFSEYQQDKYLMITKKEQVTERFFELRKENAELRYQMETDLRNIKDMEAKEKEAWDRNIDYVWKKILNTDLNDKENKALLITISVLRDELQKLQSI